MKQKVSSLFFSFIKCASASSCILAQTVVLVSFPYFFSYLSCLCVVVLFCLTFRHPQCFLREAVAFFSLCPLPIRKACGMCVFVMSNFFFISLSLVAVEASPYGKDGLCYFKNSA